MLTDQERVMLEFHAKYPGVTAKMYGRVSGQDTAPYDLLTRMVPEGARNIRVLDLGCGDGYLLQLLSAKNLSNATLIGVDMCQEELEEARSRGLNAEFRNERAQSLSLGNDEIDYVLCHLAFVLMTEPMAVAAEIARVLKPGAWFGAVIHGTCQTDPLFERFGNLLIQFMEDQGLERWSVCYGASNKEVRDYSNDGVRKLFNNQTGFVEPIEIEEIGLPATCSMEQMWVRFSNHYDFYRLSDAGQAELKRQFMEEAAQATDANGMVHLCPYVRLVTCQTLPA